MNQFIEEDILNVLKKGGLDKESAADLLAGLIHTVESDQTWDIESDNLRKEVK